jgi:hypothetical protein
VARNWIRFTTVCWSWHPWSEIEVFLLYLWTFEAKDFPRYLPIIYETRKVTITESYHKILRMGESRDTMALS